MLVGPGGAGKGTVAAALTARDPRLWLSQSWTTRPRRNGEPEDAYVFVSRREFLDKVSDGGFLEWAEFLGNLYGTPDPEPPPGSDVLLEIDVQGAEQVVGKRPDAVVLLLLPPSDEVQRARLTARGDSPGHVDRRIATGRHEVARARTLASREVVNDQVGRAVEELAGIVASTRRKDADGP
ncbi:MAG: guanylate kinase [Acidimicrobiales bacterium]